MSGISRRDFLKLMFTSMCYPVIVNFERWSACDVQVIWHGDRAKQMIAITFDDCYDYELLCRLENLLDVQPLVHVTFFPTGIALLNTFSKDQQLWQRLRSKGHEIGYHGYSHEMPSTLDYQQTIRDFDNWTDALSTVMDKTSSFMFARPPYGDLSRNFLRVCCERDILPIMWSANWSTVHRTEYREVEQVQNGDIVILHLRHQDIENFQLALDILKNEPLRLVNMSELLFGTDQTTEFFSSPDKADTEEEADIEEDVCLGRDIRRFVCLK